MEYQEASRCPFFTSLRNQPSQIYSGLHSILCPILIYPQDVDVPRSIHLLESESKANLPNTRIVFDVG